MLFQRRLLTLLLRNPSSVIWCLAREMDTFVDLRAHVVSNVLLCKNLPDFQEFVLPLRLNTPVTIQ